MKYLSIAVFLFSGIWLSAQSSVERQVFAAQGASVKGRNVQLEWTLGEPAVSTLTTSGGFITEGFQQPTVRVEAADVMVAAVPKALLDIRVAPNPSPGQLYVQFPAEMKEDCGWELWNVNGTMLQNRQPATPADETIDISAYPDGMYLLRFSNRQGELLRMYRIVKGR